MAKDIDGGLIDKLSYIEGYISGDGKISVGFTKLGSVAKTAFTAITHPVSTLTTGIGNLWTLLQANPIALVVAGIAAFVAGFVNLYSNSEEFRNHINSFWEELKTMFSGIGDMISTLWNEHLLPLWQEFLKPLFDTLAPILKDIISVLGELFGLIMDGIVWIISTVAGEALLSIFTVVFDCIEMLLIAITGIVDALKGLLTFFTGVFTLDLGTALDGLKQIWDAVWGSLFGIVQKAFEPIVNLINNVINGIRNAFSSLFGGINSQASNISMGASINASSNYNIPKLANGAVIDKPTVAMMGEYAGASHNPEIVAPAEMLKQTFENANTPMLNLILSAISRVDETIKNKDTDIYMDSKKVSRAISKEQKSLSKNAGTSLVYI
jgi:hypothetical protein